MREDKYFVKTMKKLQEAFETQEEKLEACASKIAECVKTKNILHVFGTGHSHILAEELFYRAGGLGPVNAILQPSLMLHEAAELGTYLERMEGVAEFIVDRERISQGDIVIVCSNSGRNAVPIEMAMLAKKRGAFVIAMGSQAYAEVPSRHSTGKKLCDYADVFLNNFSDMGDACVRIGETNLNVGATSTVVGAALLNSVIVRAAELLAKEGEKLPFFISANGIKDADKHNHDLMEEYRLRIRSF